jgi:hypothetical protein
MIQRYVCALIFLTLVFSIETTAQNTRTVRGVVQGPDGTVVQDANVVLTTAAAGQPLTTTTDEEGGFAIKNVPEGEYMLRVNAPGFKEAQMAVTVGSTALRPLRVKLKISTVTEKVTVNASNQPILLAEENHNDVQFNEHMTMNVPSKDGNPLTVPSLFLAPSVFGNGSSSPQIIVDGVESSALDLPASSVKNVAVDQNPYSAEFGRPGKARLEVTTKRGVRSRYRGNIVAIFRNSALDARNAFASVRPLQQRGIGEVEVDGPISRTASFLLSGRYHLFNDSSVVSALTPSGPVIENVMAPVRSTHLFSRIDKTLSRYHRISVLYKFLDRTLDNQGIGGFDLPQRGTNSFNHENEVKILETATPSANVWNQVRLTYKQERQSTASVNNQPALLVLGAFNSGGAQISKRVIEKMGDVEDVASIFHGKHDFHFGGGIRPRFFSAEDSANFGGTFTFSTLSDYENGKPVLFAMNTGTPAVYFHQHEFFTFFQDDIRVRPSFSVLLGLRHQFQSNVSGYKNFAPRLALAYAPGKGQTVLRGGFGVFYERQPVIMDQQSLLYGGSAIRQVIISNPSYPNPFATGETPAQVTPSILRIAPSIHFPYLMQGSLAIERRIGRGQNFLTLELMTVRGVELYRTRNINAPLPSTMTRPNPNFINIDQFESSATSRVYSAAITYKGHFRKADIVAQYTLARSLDSASSMFSLPANNYDLLGEWGRSDYDRRHRFNVVLLYSLPAGFRVSGIVNAWSGLPYNIVTGLDNNGDTVVNDRPSGLWRNAGRGPGYTDVDFRLARRWRLARREHPPSIEFAADAFNALNHVNFENYVGDQTSPFYGQANVAYPARQLQLTLRFIF